MELDLSVHGYEFNRRYNKREFLWDDFYHVILGDILSTTPKEVYDRDDFTDFDTLRKIRKELVNIEIKDFTDEVFNFYDAKMREILDRYRDLPKLKR